ncbi:MAG: recombinase family protein, partial [Solirubrobacterales bacterium]|nr:recombinase family protein [Solirubrobacterales bacterium]
MSTDDAQDPSLSIPRQLASCKRAIEPAAGDVVAHYWDVESDRKGLADRGKGDGAGLGVSVPHEGGLTDLLDAAANGRVFDALIVESIDRLSRMTADATQIERQLEQRDIGLFAADEPMTANATAILTRRVKQGVAEWYVRDLIEKSRRGMEESARQGWHTGGPVPYGYCLEQHPHPNPHKIQAMLRNPKYTGYNVWGRHGKRRGRPFIRPREHWVWSPAPVYEPLVPKELFELVEERARRNEIRAKYPLTDYP